MNPMLRASIIWLFAVLILLSTFVLWSLWTPAVIWTDRERALIDSLSLSQLGPVPASPSNAVADDPRAVALGRELFADPALSINGEIACSSCHHPDENFTDGRLLGQALDTTSRHTMSIIGSAWSPWQYWDGRRDSLWSQALGPLEDPAEQGSNRLHIVRTVLNDTAYRAQWQAIFGTAPELSNPERFPEHASPLGKQAWREAWHAMAEADREQVNQLFAQVGKLLAAWERSLQPPRTRFDDYADSLAGLDGRQRGKHSIEAESKRGKNAGEESLSPQEKLGLRLFIGKAKCIDCHNGPLFTNNAFHNTGILSAPGELPDRGRIEGLRQLLQDPFNCLGAYSDADAAECLELRYVLSGQELLGAFRTPGLRNVAETAPYMHKGQIADLSAVIDHYNEAPLAMIGHNEAEIPLGLSRREKHALEAFLLTLSSEALVSEE